MCQGKPVDSLSTSIMSLFGMLHDNILALHCLYYKISNVLKKIQNCKEQHSNHISDKEIKFIIVLQGNWKSLNVTKSKIITNFIENSNESNNKITKAMKICF